ncbi:hypothetical protein TRFO_37212 [Tritrichomonas foetus]|uniref:Tetraspanin family protein n=1 Tax=Tritrichomonas foetus TaxID=1144522 RepID=A0A1J4JE85_9EUKA|nr:hypothetical protein TRFO_37212 [Tritrichomonas foetus]|eukprot:OHS96599.1 hypothetical protein TRFO_37212 [Tritrichomonas foetus]
MHNPITLWFSACIFLFMIAGHLGISLFSMHWFSLMRYDECMKIQGVSWKVISIIIAVFTILALLILILSISYSFNKYMAISAGLLMIASFGFIVYLIIIIDDSQEEKVFTKGIDVLGNYSKFFTDHKCVGFSKFTDCNMTEQPLCCDQELKDFVHYRFYRTRLWYIIFSSCWIGAFVILAPILYATYRKHQ